MSVSCSGWVCFWLFRAGLVGSLCVGGLLFYLLVGVVLFGFSVASCIGVLVCFLR